jgi:hypothetical protein
MPPGGFRAARILFAISLLAAPASGVAAPTQDRCEEVDRRLPEREQSALNIAVSRQLHQPGSTVLRSFRLRRWRILFVQPPQLDPAFLFFRGRPDAASYVTLWAGSAAPGEEREVRAWITRNAQGIPPALAECFVGSVTHR